MTQQQTIWLYTDGSASGNPGPGGYGAILRCGSLYKEFSGGFALTTNNRMELLAVISGLEAIRWDKAKVVVTTDSKYVVDAVNNNWLGKWLATGFKNKKNPDLWLRLVPLLKKHEVTFVWVKGHNGHPENERCDALAVAAGSRPDLPPDEGYIEGEGGVIAEVIGNPLG